MPSSLACILDRIECNDQNYEVRYKLVFEAIATALMYGFKAGIRIDPKEPEWPVAFIDLPTGQVSWHLPQYDGEWDGHGTEEKYRRCAQYVTELRTLSAGLTAL